MSLINKMLQDLDARRAQGTPGVGHTYNPMPRNSGPSRTTLIVSITTLIAGIVLFAGAYAAWRFYQQRPAVQSSTPPVTITAAPARVVPAPAAALAANPPAAAATPAGAPAAATVTSKGVTTTITQMPRTASGEATPSVAPVAQAAQPAREAEIQTEEKAASKPEAVAKPAAVPSKPRQRIVAEPPAMKPAAAGAPAVPQGRVMSTRQSAESMYRRATAALQEGRVRDAIILLEDALESEPRHDAARQTLVGLLVEQKRNEDAMRVLQNGLVLDPRQPSMAMLLARLQIEHGGTGIDTLLRSLPYAAGDAEYHGFLAGALQRAQRHREAIEQYQAAVRTAPGNGVWWMGLGISLQAEKRMPEAADAYGRALGTGSLSPDLRTFVERRLDQSRR